jgi:hypothetical protein
MGRDGRAEGEREGHGRRGSRSGASAASWPTRAEGLEGAVRDEFADARGPALLCALALAVSLPSALRSISTFRRLTASTWNARGAAPLPGPVAVR